MKISLYIERIAKRSGGAERVVVNVANQLSMHGYDVEIVCYEDTEGEIFYKLDSKVVYRNLKVVAANSATSIERISKRLTCWASRYDRMPLLNKVSWSLKNRPKIKRLSAYFEDNPSDLIISFLPPTFVVTSFVAAKLGIQYILSLHNVPREDFENPKRWDQNIKNKKLMFKALENSSANTVILEEFKEYFSSKIKPHTFMVRNFICKPEVNPPPILSRPKRIIAVGRYAAPKDHKTLIKAWANIHADHPEWSVSIYGDGPLKNELEKIIKEHQLGGSICLHGPTKNINSEYANSQIFCIPSLFEGFGLVTVEAMSLGLPCVGFASCPGTNRIIDDDHGRLVDCDDLNKVEALAEQLKILILDSSLRDQLSAKAIKNAEDYFVENRISDWLKIIKNVTHE